MANERRRRGGLCSLIYSNFTNDKQEAQDAHVFYYYSHTDTALLRFRLQVSRQRRRGVEDGWREEVVRNAHRPGTELLGPTFLFLDLVVVQ